jgi:hypothetical protein
VAPDFDSALLIYDKDAGYRNFLGGDAVTGAALSEGCDSVIEFNESFVSSEMSSSYPTRLSLR